MTIYYIFIFNYIFIHSSLIKLYNVLVGGNQSQLHHLLLVLPDYRGKKNICLQQTIRKGKKNNLLRAPNLFALGKLSKPLGDLPQNWICRQQGQFKKAPWLWICNTFSFLIFTILRSDKIFTFRKPLWISFGKWAAQTWKELNEA